MKYKFFLVKELTNTQGQDGSKISIYENEDLDTAKNNAIVGYHQLLASLHNADDVLYAVVQLHDEYGNVLGGEHGYKEIVDHRPKPEPEPSNQNTGA